MENMAFWYKYGLSSFLMPVLFFRIMNLTLLLLLFVCLYVSVLLGVRTNPSPFVCVEYGINHLIRRLIFVKCVTNEKENKKLEMIS